MNESLDLLVISDLHTERASHQCAVAARRAGAGLELLKRIHADLTRSHSHPDAVVVLGDLVDNGHAENASEDLEAIREELARYSVPVISIPGNHDGERTAFEAVFGKTGVPLELNGYLLMPFVDQYDAQDRAERSEADLQALLQAARCNHGRPIIALQHNPVFRVIQSDYPYMLMNRQAVMQAYTEAGVVLSLSGHFHAGQSLETGNGVAYATCPALCEPPYSYLLVHIKGSEAEIQSHALASSSPANKDNTDSGLELEDFHCHTEFAYCATTVNVEGVLTRSREFGIRRQSLTEHAGQLYVKRDAFWHAEFLDDPDLWLRERAAGRERMSAYRRAVLPYRSECVGVGLETDCDGAGRIMVHEEDMQDLDVLVGAVHFVPETASNKATPAKLKREFMQYTQWLVTGGVDVLAHPFRLFVRNGIPEPVELYDEVVDLLAAHRCAAEINMHGYQPQPEFYARCMARGVKISFGSDSHALWEVGGFNGYLALLRKAGAPENPVELNKLLLHGFPRRAR